MTTVAEPAAPPGALQPDRPDVFVSYSRRDKEFVEKLLLAELVGKEKDVWIDLQDIPPAADWRDRVWRGIEAAKAFMFVLSPDSVTSKICLDELERAVEQNKRLIPAVRRDVDPERVPAALERPNWIWLRDEDDFGEQFAQLVEALETDLDWRDIHARLGARANEWKRAGDDTSFLLRGSDLDGAERWLADQAEHKERATPLQSEYIVASRRAAARRQRLTLAAVAAALAISIGLTIFALLQRSAAIDREKVARSRELAASASAQLPADPELSALLAREAARISPTDQAENALRIALGQTHVHSVLSSGGGAVWAADFSSKGDFVLTASSDRRVRVWDARSGRVAAKLRGHRFVPGESSVSPRYPVIAAFGPHDDHLVTAGDDGTVQVWDWRAERTMFRLTGRGPFVTTALLSPDGDDLLVGIGGPGGTAELWDWKLRRRVAQLGETVGAEADVFGVEDGAFSNDGRLITTGSSIGGVVRVWKRATGQLLGEILSTDEFLESVAFHPKGKLIVTASSDGSASVWDWSRAKRVADLRGHEGSLNDASFSPDGKLVITASEDGTAIVWDWATEQEVVELRGHRGALTAARFSPNGQSALTAGEDGTARIWTRLVQRPLASLRLPGSGDFPSAFTSVSFSPDGKSILTGDSSRTARVWDWRKKKPVLELRESEEAFFEESGGPWMVASFSPDGRLILTASDPGFRVWDASTGQSLAFLPHANPGTTGGAFGKEDALVVTANWDGVARVWDWRNDRVVAELKADDEPVGRAAFSPDGDQVVTTTASPEPTMRVWDWRTRKVVATLRPAAGSSFSPDGKLLAALGLTVRIWNWGNDRVIAELRGPGFPFDAEFSRNGKFVVTSTGDVSSGHGGIQIWDWAAEQPILKLPVPFSDEVSLSPDARLIAAGAVVYECDVCGSLESLLALTPEIVTRELSAAERAKYVE